MRKRLLAAGAIGLLAITLMPRNSHADPTEKTFAATVERQLELDYLLSLPAGYESNPEKSWPLVVFLHGSGERGDDLSLLKKHGPPARVEAGEDIPFILASPQCPAESWWTEEPVLELVDHLEAEYRVDSSRIYLTGLSMGGYGTWHFSSVAPHRFAAIAPICGGGTPYMMRRLPHLPVWAFHGDADTVVPPEETTRLVEELKEHGNTRVRMTIYPEVGHNSWTEAYANPELYEWLLSHERVEEEPVNGAETGEARAE